MKKEILSMSADDSIFARMGRASGYLEKIGEIEHATSVLNAMTELAKDGAMLERFSDTIKSYKGITPDTVKEMKETLEEVESWQNLLTPIAQKSPYREKIYATLLRVRQIVKKVQ